MIRNVMVFLLVGLLTLAWVGCGSESTPLPKNEPVSKSKIDSNVSLKEKQDLDGEAVQEGQGPSPLQASSSPTQPEEKPVPKESPGVGQIQEILMRANPEYRGQGKLHEENGVIVAAEFPGCKLRDLSPLRGLSLMGLDLSGNPVREIRHLRGMPLRTLFLENTRVESLLELSEAKLVELRLNNSPIKSLRGLEGQPLENLYAVGTQINEVSPLSSSNLRQLWLSESPVSDVSGLAGLPLVSLTLHRTLVDDLSFVRKLPVLQRLHIGETLISDLSPLEGLNLTRLVFTPPSIRKGLAVAQSLHNLKEIGTAFDEQRRDLTNPEAFWAQF
jgi:hypothetical protein